MNLKSKLRSFCKRNKVLARNYDKLTWYKSRLVTAFISDADFARKSYRKKTGKTLNLEQPQTFDEKLWYLKIHNRDPRLTICSDKYRVREYVEQCGLGHILNELYGVYDDARDVDFSKFREPVFIKCNHLSDGNIIYYPSKPFDRDDFVKRFNFLLKQNYYVKSREWNYKYIYPKILVEKILKNHDGTPLYDYRFMCFGGVPKLMMMDIDTCAVNGTHRHDAKRNIYDENMRLLDVRFTRDRHDVPLPISLSQFNEMKKYAAILSAPFTQCRVDFYNIDGNVYFGEMTFYHAGGVNNIQPIEWDLKIGSWIDISNIKAER